MEDRITYESFVLAGGKSSRMGSDKGLVNFHGKKMIEHVLNSLRLSYPISIISDNQEYRQFGHNVYSDIYKNCGPLGGIHSALYNSNSEWNIVLSCDLPLVTSDFLLFLLKNTEAKLCDAIVPVHKNKVEPLCALYHKSSLSKIENLILKKELKMQSALEKLNTIYVEVPKEKFDADVLFRNINSPADVSH
jgi:molybdopterin-guanine dinucleotide biosynthesis protein A